MKKVFEVVVYSYGYCSLKFLDKRGFMVINLLRWLIATIWLGVIFLVVLPQFMIVTFSQSWFGVGFWLLVLVDVIVIVLWFLVLMEIFLFLDADDGEKGKERSKK